MSIGYSTPAGNGKGQGIPPLKRLRLKRLLCFRESQWEELNRLLYEGFKKKHSGRKKVKKKQKIHQQIIYSNMPLSGVPTEEPAQNIWELPTDEEHRWGDLTREEELKLKSILKGTEYPFK